MQKVQLGTRWLSVYMSAFGLSEHGILRDSVHCIDVVALHA